MLRFMICLGAMWGHHSRTYWCKLGGTTPAFNPPGACAQGIALRRHHSSNHLGAPATRLQQHLCPRARPSCRGVSPHRSLGWGLSPRPPPSSGPGLRLRGPAPSASLLPQAALPSAPSAGHSLTAVYAGALARFACALVSRHAARGRLVGPSNGAVHSHDAQS